MPDGMTVTVLENTDELFHLVLPPVPSDELPEGDLEAVAGGRSFIPPYSVSYSMK